MKPRVYADKNGDLWLDPGTGELMALDDSFLNRVIEAWPQQPFTEIEEEFGPLTQLIRQTPISLDLPSWLRKVDDVHLPGTNGKI